MKIFKLQLFLLLQFVSLYARLRKPLRTKVKIRITNLINLLDEKRPTGFQRPTEDKMLCQEDIPEEDEIIPLIQSEEYG